MHQKQTYKKIISRIWKILNGALAVFFLYLIVNAWIQVLFFNNADKQYYYEGTLFIIPLITCLIAFFGWSIDDANDDASEK